MDDRLGPCLGIMTICQKTLKRFNLEVELVEFKNSLKKSPLQNSVNFFHLAGPKQTHIHICVSMPSKNKFKEKMTKVIKTLLKKTVPDIEYEELVVEIQKECSRILPDEINKTFYELAFPCEFNSTFFPIEINSQLKKKWAVCAEFIELYEKLVSSNLNAFDEEYFCSFTASKKRPLSITGGQNAKKIKLVDLDGNTEGDCGEPAETEFDIEV